MEISEDRLFSVAEISQRVNLPKHTLRYWEKEFNGAIIPLRTHGNQRRYTAENIQVIERIKAMRDNGVGIAEIKRALSLGTKVGSREINKIEWLVSRVAEVVRAEVHQFLEKESSRRTE